jgi:LysR family transcriptional regulator, regulator of abg operon
MKIQTLKALLRVEEVGSLRAAAASLHVSQPALTLAIQQIEEEVGAPLLVRTRRGITFTSYGEALLRHARLIVSESHRAQEEIAQMRGRWEGQIRLSASPAISLSILPQALRPFMNKYPQVRIHCIDGVSPMINPALRAGTLDFSLTPVRTDDIESGMVAEVLFEREIVVVAHESNPMARATRLAQLMEVPWVYASPSPGPGAIIETAFQAAGLEAPKPVMICESLLALPDMVAHSKLFTTLPIALYERAHRSLGLCIVPIEDHIPRLQIAILRMESVPLTLAAQELLSWVRFAARQ